MPSDGRMSELVTVSHWFVITPASAKTAVAKYFQIRSWASIDVIARMLPPAGRMRICWTLSNGGTSTRMTSVFSRSSS